MARDPAAHQSAGSNELNRRTQSKPSKRLQWLPGALSDLKSVKSNKNQKREKGNYSQHRWTQESGELNFFSRKSSI